MTDKKQVDPREYVRKESYQRMLEHGKKMIEILNQFKPTKAQDIAVTKIEEAWMWSIHAFTTSLISEPEIKWPPQEPPISQDEEATEYVSEPVDDMDKMTDDPSKLDN
jgi:hypothetical protein